MLREFAAGVRARLRPTPAAWLPPLAWLPAYTRAAACADLWAGLTVGVLIVPQARPRASTAAADLTLTCRNARRPLRLRSWPTYPP